MVIKIHNFLKGPLQAFTITVRRKFIKIYFVQAKTNFSRGKKPGWGWAGWVEEETFGELIQKI